MHHTGQFWLAALSIVLGVLSLVAWLLVHRRSKRSDAVGLPASAALGRVRPATSVVWAAGALFRAFAPEHGAWVIAFGAIDSVAFVALLVLWWALESQRRSADVEQSTAGKEH